ncbi:MAG: transposase, partial [Bacteroidales bacterium]|nr:transposase [Bacteroidales bacterium]
NKVHCKNCCEKHHRNGETTYYHQMLGASIVHPDEKVVIPIAPEPIVKSDGMNKNDCESNASKRLLKDFRREHPHLKTIIVEDALASNYPHLSLLDDLKLEYIISAKPGNNSFLFDWIKHVKAEEIIINKYDAKTKKGNIKHTFRYVNNVPLNDEHYDYRVNVLEYWEEKPNGKKQHFSWVTSFEIKKDNVFDLMRAGRARWKIENETFNTLKNQGYNFEHNYGHGKNNLCSVLIMLMLLAFLIDQVQFLCCNLRKRLKEKCGSWQVVFEEIRSMIRKIVWDSWSQLYNVLLHPETHPPPNWFGVPINVNR